MSTSFVLAMFVLPVAIIGVAVLLAWRSLRADSSPTERAR